MAQSLHRRLPGIAFASIQRAQTMESPQPVDRSGIQANFIGGGIGYKLNESVLSPIQIPTLHQQPLGVLAPAHIGMAQGLHKFLCTGSFQAQGVGGFRILIDSPVDTPVLAVALRVRIRIAPGLLLAVALRVASATVVVPVSQPYLRV